MADELLGREVLELRTDAGQMKAGLADVKADLRALGSQLKTTEGQASSFAGAFKTSLAGLAGAVGASLSVGAIVSFGKHVFDTAGQIGDLSTQLGISTDAVQGFKFAAEQSGSSLDAVAAALNKMNVNLAGGDKATVAALTSVGLQFKTIRAMKPEDAFLAIADAIRGVPDAMTRADVAMQLFGKGGAQLLPAIMEDFRGVAGSASKMSGDTIRDLKAASDAWQAFGTQVTIISGNMIGDLMKLPDAVNQVTSSFTELSKFAADMAVNGIGAAFQHVIDFSAKAKEAAAQVKLPDVGSWKDLLPPDLTSRVKSIAAAYVPLTEEQKKAAAAAEAHAKAVRALADQFTGRSAIRSAQDALEAISLATRAGVDVSEMALSVQEQINKTATEAIAALERQGRAVDPTLLKLQAMTSEAIAQRSAVKTLTDEWAKLGAVALGDPNKLSRLGPNPDMFNELFLGMKDPAFIKEGGNVFANALVGPGFKEQLQTGLLDSLRGFAGGLESAIATGGSIAGALKSYATNVAKDFTSTALSFIPGIGPMLSQFAGPIVEGFKKLFGGMFGNATKSSIKEAFGSYDQLRTLINGLTGDTRTLGDELWIQLTQRTGKNDKAGAAALIERINGLLEEEKQKQADVAAAAEASATKQTEAATKVQTAIEGIDSEMQSLMQSIADEAPEEEMGVIEKQTRERIARLAEERKTLEEQLAAEQEGTATNVETVGSQVETLGEKLADNARRWMDWGSIVRGEAGSIGLSGISLPVPTPIPMASGGFGRVTRPTLFLAGEAGAEDYAFSGGGRRFPSGGGDDRTQRVIVTSGRRTLIDSIVQDLPREVLIRL